MLANIQQINSSGRQTSEGLIKIIHGLTMIAKDQEKKGANCEGIWKQIHNLQDEGAMKGFLSAEDITRSCFPEREI